MGSVFEPTGVDSGSLRVNFGPLKVDFWAMEGKFELWWSILGLWKLKVFSSRVGICGRRYLAFRSRFHAAGSHFKFGVCKQFKYMAFLFFLICLFRFASVF